MVRNQGGNYATIVYIEGVFEPAKRLAKTANNKRFAEQYHRLESTSTLEKNETHIMPACRTGRDNRSRIAVIRDGDSFPNDIDAEYYVLEDHLGSGMLRLKATAGGSVLDREEYYPFGDSSLRIWTKKRYQYVGKEKDSESGLYYYGARYYAAWTCRFISVDPLAGKYPSLNPYLYAYNNPIRANDPTGMEGEEGQTSNDSGNGDKVTGSSGQYSYSNEGIDPSMNSLQGDRIPGVSDETPASIVPQDKTFVDTDKMVNRGESNYEQDSPWLRFFSDMEKLVSSGFKIQIWGSAGDSSESPGKKIGFKEDILSFDFGEKSQEILGIIITAYSNKMVNKEEISKYKDFREDAVDLLDMHGHDGEKIMAEVEKEIGDAILNGEANDLSEFVEENKQLIEKRRYQEVYVTGKRRIASKTETFSDGHSVTTVENNTQDTIVFRKDSVRIAREWIKK